MSLTASPIIAALDHLVLRVHGLEQSAQFYTGVLGCRIDRRRDELGMIHLRAGSVLIDLISVEGPLGHGGGRGPARDGHNLDHFCLSIANLSIEQLQQHLLNHGVPSSDIRTRYGASGEGASLYLRDNEGNGIELRSMVSAT